MYFCPLLGAIIADSFLGLYNSILVFGLIALVGLAITSVASIESLGLPIV